MTESIIESSAEVALGAISEASIQILHVDDDSGFLKAAKQILEMQGTFEVETAASVDEAIEMMKGKTYDAVVSDYVMPERSGLDFLEELRQKGDAIPFILFTGKCREEVAIEAWNLGADHYLNKIGDPKAVYCELAHGIRQAVERKRASEETWKREQKLRAILASSPDIITVSDLQGNIVDCSEAAWKLTGFSSKEELLGRNSFEFIAEKDRERALENLKKTFEEGTTRNVEYTLLKKNGEEYTGELSAAILKDSSCNPIGFVGVVRETTKRKKAEQMLIESEIRYRTQFEEAMDAVFLADAETGILIDCNRAACELVGKDKPELVGKHQRILHPPEVEGEFSRTFKQHLKEKEGLVLEAQVVTKKGEIRDVEIKANVFELGSKRMIRGIFRDITERKKAEDELRSSEERLKILFDYAPDAYYLNNLKGNFVDGNRAAEELTGYARSELIGKSFLKLRLLSRKQVMKAAKLLVKNALGKSTGPDEFVLNSKDGTPVSVEIRTFPVKIKDQTLVLGIARDITERKKAEDLLKREMKKVGALNEKLSVVGRLTRHDARNKLSAVTMNVFLAKQKLADDHEVLGSLNEIESAVKQVERIFVFASIYEKLGAEELVYVDVGKAFDEAVSLFLDLQGIRVVNDCRGLTVLADSLLRQLVYNLVDNSLKHGERVSRIRMYYEEGKDDLKLIYEDDGVGISKAEKEKIFREGYGKGTGYGLYLLRKMCEVYGWTIRETGKHGKGAQFTITVPRVGESGKPNYRLR